MKLIICGASGMVGQALLKNMANVHDITLVGRDVSKLRHKFGAKYTYWSWDELTPANVLGYDCIINLAGANIGAKKWSDAYKKEIINSRVDTTKKIAELCVGLGEHSPAIINASAIGIYGAHQSEVGFDEDYDVSAPATDFLSEVGRAWEDALNPAITAGIRVVRLRFAVIMSAKDGALAKIIPSFKFGMGAVLGSGQQFFPWVDIVDVVGVINYAVTHSDINGAYNIVADEVVTQKQFANTLATVLHRPRLMILPTFVVKTMFGEMGKELLLSGIKVSNEKIKQAGYNFRYNNLKSSLQHILDK